MQTRRKYQEGGRNVAVWKSGICQRGWKYWWSTDNNLNGVSQRSGRGPLKRDSRLQLDIILYILLFYWHYSESVRKGPRCLCQSRETSRFGMLWRRGQYRWRNRREWCYEMDIWWLGSWWLKKETVYLHLICIRDTLIFIVSTLEIVRHILLSCI